MYHYIYSITNLVNGKKYIGMTCNHKRRKIRHFSELRNNSHCNINLQRAFDKYGEGNFVFEVIKEYDSYVSREDVFKEEMKYIEKYDSFNNGYNLNIGGTDGNGFSSKFSEEDVFIILSCREFGYRVSGALSELFETSRTSIRRISSGEFNLEYKLKYESLPIEERRSIYDNFNKDVKLEDMLYDRRSQAHLKPLNEKQCLYVLSMFEFNNRRTNEMRNKLGVSNTALYNLKNRNDIYTKEFDEYTSLSFDERFDIYKDAYKYFDIKCDFM